MRLVVPGDVGARSVKWLDRVTVQDTPSDSSFQATAYRVEAADLPVAVLGDQDVLGLPRAGGPANIRAVTIVAPEAGRLSVPPWSEE